MPQFDIKGQIKDLKWILNVLYKVTVSTIPIWDTWKRKFAERTKFILSKVSINSTIQVLYWETLTWPAVNQVSLKNFFYLLWGGVLVGPKGPGGTSIPNNYCNKCQGSNKKMGKSGPPYPACRCTSESTYTQIWHAYNTERFCPMCVEVYVQIEMYGGKKWILLAHDLTTSFYPSSDSAPLRSSWPWGREGRRDFYWSGGAVRHHLGERHFHLSRLRGRRAGGARHKQQRNIQPSQIERTRDNLFFFYKE